MAKVRGAITLVQEERFQLVDGGGVAHLFVLDHHVRLGPTDLTRLWRAGEHVEVEYRDASQLIARIATSVRRVSATEVMP